MNKAAHIVLPGLMLWVCLWLIRRDERAKKTNGQQPRIPWAQAKKELGLP